MTNGAAPIALWLELETRCNLRCPFCYNHWKDGTHSAPKSLATAALLDCLERLLDEVSCNRAALSGGEPLLHPDLDQFVSFFHARGVATVLTTNGVLLTAERLTHLRSIGLSAVQVPLHSAVPKIHDQLSGVRCWRRSVETLALAQEMRINVTPVFVATSLNVMSVEGVLELLYLLGIHHLIFNRFVPSGAGIVHQGDLDVTETQVIDALYRINAVADRLDSVIKLGVPVRLTASQLEDLHRIHAVPCSIGGMHSQYTVDAAGDLKHCNQSPIALGNLQRSRFADLVLRLDGLKRDLFKDGINACYCASLQGSRLEAGAAL